ncbi:LysR family transcriptional regulator [Shewanella sp. NFH-SH190041]|uniref:LysR family transcriptional regulator n=1 Tax=Shewanella sp. NFH-SH190041 TaxID=2950245 RepID=UPI0021C33A07|nr:LysR family transcriptional regulator [Shewanella sp. NFH-SH190041]BDM65179.1 LysR family transcriptional regulator [Shewanella sp. NFH-SH190041]
MEIRQLQQFTALAKQQSFTLAARELNMAQPALSQSIKKLERQLGVTLVNRSAGQQRRAVTLTAEGKILLEHARLILGQVQQAKTQIRAMAALQAGEVRIAVPGMLGSFYLPSRLMAFRHSYPDLKLSLFEGGTRDALHMLEREDVDVAIITAQDLRDEFEHRLLVREQMVVAMSPEHSLSQQQHVSLPEFFAHELVMFKTGYFHREWMLTQANTLGLTANIAFETNLINLIKQLISQGFAITSLLQMAISKADGIISKPFEPPVFLDLHIAWKKHKPIGRADMAFIQFLLVNA